ncbi:MAG: heat-inducible transcriptional repressor HrcA [Syntrophobacteraceae bacterium]
MDELTKRDQQVLEAVVTDFIQTGEPVGSRIVSKRYGLNVSSATIRNVMADLEEMGFLHQPHTSAGRVPTEKGLRFYLDSIMRSGTLERQAKDQIREAFQDAQADVKELLRRTSLILSSFCNQAGVVLWPKLTLTRLKHIEFIRLRPHQIMVILISRSGLVHHRPINWEEDIRQEELDKYCRYLNELLDDVPLADVKQRVLEEMKKEKVLFDQLYSQALEITRLAVQFTLDNSEVYIEGQTNLLNNPEFAHVERMRRLLQTFEDKSRIIRLLDITMKSSGGVQIILGSESDLKELDEISLISSPYRRGDTLLGALGVIGPLRMDYSRIIPVVEFTAGLLSQLLEEPEEV